MSKRLIMFPIIAFALHRGFRGFGEALAQVSHVQLDHPSLTLPALTFGQKALYAVYCANWYMLGLPFTLLIAGLCVCGYLTLSRRRYGYEGLAVAFVSVVGIAAGVDVVWRCVVDLLRPTLTPGSYDLNHINLMFLSAYVLTVVLCAALWFVMLVGLECLSKRDDVKFVIILLCPSVCAIVFVHLAKWLNIAWLFAVLAAIGFVGGVFALMRSGFAGEGLYGSLRCASENLKLRLPACLEWESVKRGERCLRLFCTLGIGLIALLALCGAVGVCVENQRGVLTAEKREVSQDAVKSPYNVILINIDTLRADHLSCYGYDRPTSPSIDRFAKDAVFFQNVCVGTSWTKPSVASLLTGLYASSHTAQSHGDALPLAAHTLPEILLEHGYTTAGFVTNPNIKSIFNFHQGFELYDESLTIDRVYRKSWEDSKVVLRHLPLRFSVYESDTGGILTAKAIRWLKSCSAPFFLYVHYMDPHNPYAPPSPYDEVFAPDDVNDPNEKSIALYDGEIRYTDAQIQRLLGAINKFGLRENTLIALTADHGEEFGEHGGMGHGETLYEEVIHAPLIMRFPGKKHKGISVSELVCQVDVMPTILDFLSIAYDKDAFQGISLMPLIRGDKSGQSDRIAFSELCSTTAPTTRPMLNPYNVRAVRTSEWKLILTVASPRRQQGEELYHLAKDPAERQNLAAKKRGITQCLREEMKQAWADAAQKALTPETAALDWETLGQLKALGYVQ